MSELHKIRLKNFRLLMGEFSSKTELSEVTGIHNSYISQILSGQRNIGEKIARKIERTASKPHLWLDQEGALSDKQLELIQKVRDFPDEYLHILSAFVDSLSQTDKKN